MKPSRSSRHPFTGEGSEVTAPMTSPWRRSRLLWSWSSTCRSSVVSDHPAASCSTGTNHVARESALTATGVTVRAVAPWPRECRASASRTCIWRAVRSSTAPASVGTQGTPRRTTTCPTEVSSALIRWLTAEGLIRRASAAASKVPSSTTAVRARRCSRFMKQI